MNTTGWLDSLAQDVRYAFRGMRRSPAFTAVAVMTLAIGIGVNAAVFTLTNALFKGFTSVDGNDRILYMRTRDVGHPQDYYGVSYPDFKGWSTQAKSFDGMAACRDVARISLSDQSGRSETYWAVQVSANTFTLVGQKPLIGRNFGPADEAPGAAPVAILTYGLWARRYAKDSAIVGQTVRINGAATAVIGVMAKGFSFPNKQDLWMPLTATLHSQQRGARDDLMFVFGRLAPGVTLKSARAEMETIGSRLASAYAPTNQEFRPEAQPFNEFFHGSMILVYESMWGAVGFVLLIACANLANLLLARAVGRSREVSIRIALGAGRWRIIRQLLVESVMLSAVGGACGWWIAKWGVHAYVLTAFTAYHPAASPDVFPWFDFAMDDRVLGCLIAISAGTGLLFGLAPASRLSRVDVNTALKGGGRGAVGGGHGKHLSALLVSAEMALAVVLLAGAGVMIRSVLNIYTADVGVDTANILTTRLELHCDGPLCAVPDDQYRSAAAKMSFFDRLTARLEAIPGVASVAMASRPPAAGSQRRPYERAGDPSVDPQRRPTLGSLIITPAYFRTLRLALLSGREFTDADDASGAPAVIVNQRFASQSWPGERALGKRLRLFAGAAPEPWLTVVGVAPNVVQDFNRQTVEPLIYVPYRQQPQGGMTIIARTRIPSERLADPFRREIQTADEDLPLFGSQTLAAHLAGNYRFNYALLFLIFAAIALLLACLGLYGVVAHSVSQRTQEMGVRIAIGATARDILALVLAQSMPPLALGLTTGVAASLAVTPILRSQLVHVSPVDPLTLVITSLVLLAAATLGCLIPARRAMRVDPVVALRHE